MMSRILINKTHTGSAHLKGLLKLITAFMAIFVIIIFIAPQADKLEFVKPVVNNIDENGIDATALFYTEIEVFSTAELSIAASIKYKPDNTSKLELKEN